MIELQVTYANGNSDSEALTATVREFWPQASLIQDKTEAFPFWNLATTANVDYPHLLLGAASVMEVTVMPDGSLAAIPDIILHYASGGKEDKLISIDLDNKIPLSSASIRAAIKEIIARL